MAMKAVQTKLGMQMADEVSPALVATNYKEPPLIVGKWCMPVAGTLCYWDGYKTGPSTPNGQDAYDGKLVVT